MRHFNKPFLKANSLIAVHSNHYSLNSVANLWPNISLTLTSDRDYASWTSGLSKSRSYSKTKEHGVESDLGMNYSIC